MKKIFPPIKGAVQRNGEEAPKPSGVLKPLLTVRQRLRIATGFFLVAYPLVSVAVIKLASSRISTAGFSWLILGCLALWSALLARMIHFRRMEDRLVGQVPTPSEHEVVGITIDMIRDRPAYDRKRLFTALREQLAAIQPENLPVIDPRQRRWLRTVLKTDKSIGRFNSEWSPMAVSIVRLFANLGDAEDRAILENLACGQGPAKLHPEVQAIAAEVLPAMTLRLQAQSAQDTYLRVGEPNIGELLRPTKPLPVMETQNLLRPGTQEHRSDDNTH